MTQTLKGIASALLVDVDTSLHDTIMDALASYSLALLDRTVAAGCRIRVLANGQSYHDASPVLRRLGIDVDRWPVPPAGLFVVEERTVYLRLLGRMAIGHEVGHAIDYALGDGAYRSATDPQIRAAYAAARGFVTPYAASGIDEYMAEALRAYADDLNDDTASWPPATRKRLRRCDPTMYAIVAKLFRSAHPTTCVPGVCHSASVDSRP
jgi:hypothetical protein